MTSQGGGQYRFCGGEIVFLCAKLVGVHTVKIIRYGTVPVFFIRFRYANGIDTGYFLYFVDVFEILSRALVLRKVWWGWTSTM